MLRHIRQIAESNGEYMELNGITARNITLAQKSFLLAVAVFPIYKNYKGDKRNENR